MTTTLAPTSQWQLYLPKKIRQAMKLGDNPVFDAEVKPNGDLVLTPRKSSVLDLAGVLANTRPDLDLDNIRDLIDYSDLP